VHFERTYHLHLEGRRLSQAILAEADSKLRLCVPLKHQVFSEVHSVTIKNTMIFIEE
jgi:hypothetical protein